MGKRNQLSITLQWGHNNFIVGEETFIDRSGRSSDSFFRFYKNDLFGYWDTQRPFYPRTITENGWGEKLQPYFKHKIEEEKYTYKIILTDNDVDFDGKLHVHSPDDGARSTFSFFSWWNKESKEGGVETVENRPTLKQLDWRDSRFPYPIVSLSESLGSYPLFDHRDQHPPHTQEFFIKRLQDIYGEAIGTIPLSNDNYYLIQDLGWRESVGRLTLIWSGIGGDDVGSQETHLVDNYGTGLANDIGVMDNPGLPGEGWYQLSPENAERCLTNMYNIVKFDHQVDLDKYEYTIIIETVETCFA